MGRERELEEIATLLADGETRLLTLTGPGGVGKTRLAIQVSAGFADEARFVPLAAIDDLAAVAPAIARAVGLQHIDSDRLPEALAQTMGERSLLLVLDNIEHLPGAVPLIADLLACCPGLRVLATSRVRLRIDGEHEYLVPPLAYPKPAGLGSPHPADVAGSAAVALFVARARAANRSFALAPDNAAAVAEICARLDGLPLAIELAAARSKVLSPRMLLAQLSRRLDLLAGGSVDRPARHRTLRDTIAWSYELLSPEDQLLFRRLAVCAGGFGLELAVALAGTEGTSTISVIDRLQRLIDHSLVQPVEAGTSVDGTVPEPRFALLETIREYGLEQLELRGELDAARRAHADWMLGFVERHEMLPYHPVDRLVVRRYGADQANIEAALDWLAARDTLGFVRLVGLLGWFWTVCGFPSTERGWLERALAGEGAMESRAGIATTLGFTLLVGGDLERAHHALTGGLSIFRSLGCARGEARALMGLGVVATYHEEYDRATLQFEHALARARSLGDPGEATALTAAVLRNLGVAAHGQGRLQQAVACYTEALRLERQSGFDFGMMHSFVDLGNVARDLGDVARAGACYRDGLRLARMYGDQRIIIWILEGIGNVAAATGHMEPAALLFGAMYRWRETMGLTDRSAADDAALVRAVATVRAALGESAFTSAWRAGETLTLDQAIAKAESLPPVRDAPGRTGVRRAGVTTVDPASQPDLSPREREVLWLMASGMTDRAIAEELFISLRTAQNHVARIDRKLGVTSRQAAVAAAITTGLLDPAQGIRSLLERESRSR